MTSSRNGRYAPFTILLFCALLMMGGVSCDKIGREQGQDAGAPAEPVQKMPLPQHVTAAPGVGARDASVEKKGVAPADSEAAKPGAPAAASAPKQAHEPKRDETKKVQSPAAGEKKPQPARVGVKEQKGAGPAKGEAKVPGPGGKAKAAPVEKKPVAASAAAKPAVAEKKPAPAVATKPAALSKKQADTAQATTSVAKKKKAPVAAASGGRWTVVMGPYLLEETLASDLTRVRKAGLSATIQPTARKKAAMNRLLLAQFDDRAAAQGALDKLKQHTSDAFILEHGGKHVVYAGSYLLDSRAASEKERLATAGFTLTLKRTDVAVPSKRLVAGTSLDRGAAEKVQKKLKAAGLRGELVRQ